MTLADRIKLIDDMVEENPDVTIKTYLTTVKELDLIKSANGSEVQLAFLRKLHSEIKDILDEQKVISINKRMTDRYDRMNRYK